MYDWLLDRRAAKLWRRLAPHLPRRGRILDLGCGTGHNARRIRRGRPTLTVTEVDVADYGRARPGFVLADGCRLPFADAAFDGALALFVLQYPRRATMLLREARRVVAGPLVMLQSTFAGPLGAPVLWLRELLLGRGALFGAQQLGCVPPGRPAALEPARYMRRPALESAIVAAGWRVALRRPAPWPGLSVSRDLYLLD